MVKRILLILTIVCTLTSNLSASPTASAFGSGQPHFYPVRERMLIQSLNGSWEFKLLNGLTIPQEYHGWEQPGFNTCQWDPIVVPGNWETQGFKTPEYGKDIEEYTGLYRTRFNYNPTWNGKNVILRFDGVHFGYECYINGTKVGEFGSAFNLCQFNITPYLNTEGENVLSVKVSTRSFGWLFDTNDCWSLAGITRDVELFALDNTYLEDITYLSDVTPDLNASINVRVDVNHFKEDRNPYKLNISLSDPQNNHVLDFSGNIEANTKTYTFEGQVQQPKLWTAETPNLYRLEVCIVNSKGQVIQRANEYVGIRSVRVDGFDLKVNHQPVLLRGVCLNEITAKSGRALTYKERRQQLVMMKAANINFIRTAHYPFAPDFLQLCDEMGFYVCNEVPFGARGGGNLENPQYTPELIARADATLRRDKNRPSVIIWSLGNENPYTSIVEEVLKYVKMKDPSRPRGLPQHSGHFRNFITNPSENVDVIMGHYLNNDRIDETVKYTKKPVIYTEYAHALGLSFEDLEDRYARILREEKIIGGSIWCWSDQAIMTLGDNQKNEVLKGVRIDSLRFMDSYGQEKVPDGKAEIRKEAADGIVYGDGYPQEDFFQVRKVYTPVAIETEKVNGQSGTQNSFNLVIENRFDILSLHGYKLNWQIRNVRKVLDSGNCWLQAAARQKEKVSIKTNLPATVEFNDLMVCLEVIDPAGKALVEKNLPVELANNPKDYRSQITALPASKTRITVSKKGILSITDETGRSMVQSPLYLRVGRPATITTANKTKLYWKPYILTPVIEKFERSTSKDGVQFKLACRWDRDKDSGQYISGTVTVHISPNGVAAFDYDIQPSANAEGYLLECGLTLKLDAPFDTFHWLGAGPFTSTPSKTAYNERSTWALHKNDLRFIGNRGAVDIAVVTDRQRAVCLWSDNGNIAIENIEDCVHITQNALISGYGSKFDPPTGLQPVQELKQIKGSFMLFIDQPSQPVKFLESICKPYPTVVPEQPYLKSYGW